MQHLEGGAMSKETEDALNDGLQWLAVGAGLTIAALDWLGGVIKVAGGM